MNVVYPGPSVGGNTETHPKLADMVVAALAPALPDRVAAAEGGTACNFLFGGVHPKTGDYYANYHLEGGGWGAKSYDDGNDAIIVKNGNCRNTPVEIFETRYPLRTSSSTRWSRARAAPGRMRGGLGTRRILRVRRGRRGDRRTRSSTAPRRASARWASTAAARAAAAAILVKRQGDSEFRTFKEVFGTVSPSKFTNIRLTGGDEVLIDSPGGGGYGRRARARPRARRARRRRGLRLRGAGARPSTAWSGAG